MGIETHFYPPYYMVHTVCSLWTIDYSVFNRVTWTNISSLSPMESNENASQVKNC